MILLKLFLTFFKIGLFTFGGGYAMIPLINSEVLGQGWISEYELIDFIAVSESTPGPFAINISTYIGIKTAGILGAVCSTLGVVMPSFIVILVVARFFAKYKSSKVVAGIMSGLRPCVVGLIACAVINVAKTALFNGAFSFGVLATPGFIVSFVIFVIMLFMSLKKVHPVAVVALSAGFGIVAGLLGLITL